MAVDTDVIYLDQPGLDLTVDFYPYSGSGYGAAAATDLSFSESGTIDGVYTVTVSTALTGLHRAHVKESGQVIAIMEVILYDITDTLTLVETGTAEAMLAAAYPGRVVYIDTVNGTAGTAPGHNGTACQPVASWADAKTVADLLGYTSFYLVNGSNLSLSSSAANCSFDGENYSFNANGETINGAVVKNATVSFSVSSSTTSATTLINCKINLLNVTVGITLIDCIFTSGNEHELKGSCRFYRCCADTQLSNPPIFDLQGSGAFPSNTATFVGWNGDLRLKRVYSGSKVHIYGAGIITIDADCTGGVIRRHGDLQLVDNVAGGFENLASSLLEYEPQPVDMIEINGQADAAQTVQEVHQYVDRLTVVDSSFTRTETEFETDGMDEDDDTLKGKTITWFNPSGAPANTGQYFILSSEGTINNSNGNVKITLDPLRPLDAVPAVGDVIRILGARSQ
jgi:hypothetical protein